MNRNLVVATTACALAAAITSVVIPVWGGLHVGAAAAAIVVVAALCVAAVGVQRLEPRWTLVFVVLAVTPFGVTSSMLGLGNATVRLAPIIALVALLASMVLERRGVLPVNLLVDGATALLGGALTTWIVVIHPLIDRDVAATGPAVIAAISIPACFLAATLAGWLVASGLYHSRVAWAVLALVTINGVGHLVVGLSATGQVLSVSPDTVRSILFVATFAVAGAVVWPSRADDEATADVATAVPVTAGFGLRMRAALLVLAAWMPIVLVAAVPTGGTTDRMVRTVGAVVLVSLGAWRTLHALNESRRAHGELLDRADHDDLTRLPNRRRFVATTAVVLDTTWRTERRPALIHVNLDRFKNINDSLGHDGANQILLEVARRLRSIGDELDATVARLSGDEFAVLIPTAVDDEAMETAEAVRTVLSQPIDVADQQVFATASIGVVVAPRNRTLSSDELLRRADIAMHRAKADGRNCIAMFDDSMQATLASRMDIEHALHGAIARNELCLAHQPIVDITTGEMTGFEALMRWERADGSMVRPDQFIPIAEETGIINDLGAWALLQALGELRRWIDDGTVAPTATMSVNVSPRQIADPGFADVVREALMRSGVPAHLLWLEVTESMMLSEPDLARATLKQIRAMGVHIALDDFGTGFSSLSLLQGFPLQRIKIDRAFVHGVADSDNDQALVRTIIAMGTSLGLDIVAEGVESIDQMVKLRDLGCPKAQGYLISRPVPSEMMSSTMLALRDLAALPMFSSNVDALR